MSNTDHSIATSGAQTPDSASNDAVVAARVVHGQVVNVKLHPTRGMTRIEIDVPSEAHIATTALLLGQSVIVFATNFDKAMPYGVLETGADGVARLCNDAHKPGEGPGARQAQPAAAAAPAPRGRNGGGSSAPNRNAPAAGARGHGGDSDNADVSARLGSPPRVEGEGVDIVRWLGVRCKESEFQNFLGVRNEADAITRVRNLCEVDSRAQIPRSATSRALFFSLVYAPFLQAIGRGPSHGGAGEGDEAAAA